MSERIGHVAESNSAPTTTLTGTLATGARSGMSVTGVAFAGQQLGNVGAGFEGIFGTLTVNANGSFSYVLDNEDPDTNLIAGGEQALERFTVTFQLGGVTQTAAIEFAIGGVDETVRSFFQTSQPVRLQESVTLDEASYARFTGNEGYVDERSGDSLPPIALDNFGSIVLAAGNGEPFATSVVLTGGNFTRNFGRIAAATTDPNTDDITGVIGAGENHGVVSASASAGPDSEGNTNGRAVGWAGVEVNSGLIEAISTYDVYGVRSLIGGRPLHNSGFIYVEGGGAYTSPSSRDLLEVIGVRADETDTITNSGTIHAVSNTPLLDSVGVRFFGDAFGNTDPVFIDNSGTIVADIAVEVSGRSGVVNQLVNTGLIEGRVELLSGSGQIFNGAAGTIRGNVNLRFGPDLVMNSGAIIGKVDLNAESDFYDASTGGTIIGEVLGGFDNDRFRGGASADTFIGGGQSDWLEGGGGADQLTGGEGADVFVYTALTDSTSNARDTITDFESGVDTIHLGALGQSSFTLTPSGENTILRAGSLEVVVIGTVLASDIVNTPTAFRLDGTNDNDLLVGRETGAQLFGFAGSDTLHGGDGNDLLDGGTGGDTLFGGSGDDVYIVDSLSDSIVETADGGRDELRTVISTTLPAFVEVGVIIGSAGLALYGNDRDNTIIGNAGNDELSAGFGGNNTLIGRGGADQILFGFGSSDNTSVYEALSDSTRANPDTVYFSNEQDRIDLTALDVERVTIGEYRSEETGFGLSASQLILTIVSVQTSLGELVIEFDDTPSLGMFVWNRAPGERVQLFGLDEDDTLLGGTSNDRIEARGGADSLFGRGGADVLIGGLGDDAIDGGTNVDTAVFAGNASDYAITQTATGVFEVSGAEGTDTLTLVEFARFDDETVRLRPGTGTGVTFDPGNPASYQDAMNAIRDFKGNDLGGDGAWTLIGSYDVNGDGDIDNILVNDAIGRFATVGTADDGLVYFSDHGWAGETRVAGIYIDPLVQNGTVEQGGPFDSQQRFRNDLRNDNIGEALGSNDYNDDGIWEVFFALADGTAYLRALMHGDGNIRYANYRSEEQVRNYLEANGFGEETFGDWFGGNTGSGGTGSGVVAASAAASGLMWQPQDMGISGEFFG